MIADDRMEAVRHSRLRGGMQNPEGHMWQGCKEGTAVGHQLVENSNQQAEAELGLRAKERIQGREYSVQQRLTGLVVLGLPWRAGSPHSDAPLHFRRLLLVVKYHLLC